MFKRIKEYNVITSQNKVHFINQSYNSSCWKDCRILKVIIQRMVGSRIWVLLRIWRRISIMAVKSDRWTIMLKWKSWRQQDSIELWMQMIVLVRIEVARIVGLLRMANWIIVSLILEISNSIVQKWWTEIDQWLHPNSSINTDDLVYQIYCLYYINDQIGYHNQSTQCIVLWEPSNPDINF